MKFIISPQAEKEIKKLPKVTQIIIAKNIRSIGEESKNRKETVLKEYKNVYRIRVGDYRIVYKRSHKLIYIISIGHRKDIYKILDRLLS